MGLIRFPLFCFMAFLVLFSFSLDGYEATQFTVGGKDDSWRIPSSPDALNAWAEKERFKVGDSLVFKYDSKTDSVMEVEEGDYKKCIKTKAIKEYHDGNTVIPIVESGSFFFISGADGHCEKGEKLEVRVLSHKHSTPPPAQAPKASPVTSESSVFAPAESPKSGSDATVLRIIDIFLFGVAAFAGIAMV